MFKIVIDQQRCKSCGLCIEFCPKSVIETNPELNEAGFHAARIVSQDDCTGCGSCALMCPEVCIEIYRVEVETPANA